MSAYLSTASLLLYPEPPTWFPEDSATFINQLRNIGLVADAIDRTSYYAGEHFFDHIAFMGCAPSIRFAPEAGEEKFTHIRIHVHESITALIGTHAHAPSCPQCKKAFIYSSAQLEALNSASQWQCQHCQEFFAPWTYHWRKGAGFARVFIEVTDIYPKEAVPQQELLDALQKCSGTQWQHCYLF